MASTLSAPPLFARLKAATAAQHAELEARVDPLSRFRDRAAYGSYLARAHPLYRAVENELAKQDWTTLGLDFAERQKAFLLEDDLAFLGVTADGSAPVAPIFPDRATAIGTFYVLEGATLGGQVISRHLKTLGLEPGRGASFFAGYGPRTGEMWKAFQESATRGVQTERDVEAAVDGARAMFDLFGRWMSS